VAGMAQSCLAKIVSRGHEVYVNRFRMNKVTWSPSGRFVAALTGSTAVHVWRVEREPTDELNLFTIVAQIEARADAITDNLFFVGKDKALIGFQGLFDLKTMEFGAYLKVSNVVLPSRNWTHYVGKGAAEAFVKDPITQRTIRTFPTKADNFGQIYCNPAGTVVIAPSGSSWCVYEIATGQEIFSVRVPDIYGNAVLVHFTHTPNQVRNAEPHSASFGFDLFR